MTRCACGKHELPPDVGYVYDSKSPERHHYAAGATEGCEIAAVRQERDTALESAKWYASERDAAHAAGYAAGVEAAAKEAESRTGYGDVVANRSMRSLAAAIRALAAPPPEGDRGAS